MITSAPYQVLTKYNGPFSYHEQYYTISSAVLRAVSQAVGTAKFYFQLQINKLLFSKHQA